MDITCASTSNPCSKWEIRPTGTVVSGANRARLSYQAKSNSAFVLQGDYYMSFSIDLTNTVRLGPTNRTVVSRGGDVHALWDIESFSRPLRR